ncbi:MAG: hypothetical protein IT428_17115 [Planctomycetaceae bacterium]|nr:hypothetical protein [Planctomycetaceae bacterium]
MAIAVDLSEDKLQDGMDNVVPGKAHVVMQKFHEYGSKNGDHMADFEVVAHDNPAEVGKIHREYFPQKSSVAWKLRALAIGLGLTTMDECQKAKEEGRALQIEYQDGVGRQMFVTFTENEYQGKKSVRVEGNMWPLTSDKCKGHPRNVGMLKRSGVPLDQIPAPAESKPAAAGNGGAAKKPASTTATKSAAQPAATAAATSSGGDDEDSFGLG